MDIHDLVDSIKTKKDFDIFLEALLDNLRNNDSSWENNKLENYVDAMYGFTKSLKGYYMHKKEDVDLDKPTWKMMATILIAATHYE
ncbi:MAG: hypothetical protein ABL940_07900 [Bacteroidia bacterium]